MSMARALPLPLLLASLLAAPAAAPAQGILSKAKGKVSAGAAKLRGERDTSAVADSAGGDVAVAMRVAPIVASLGEGRLVLHEPLFVTGAAELAPRASTTIDSLAVALKQLKGAFLIGGHVDASGEPAMLQDLTERRAVALKSALVKAGVKADRIYAIGYGAMFPIPKESDGGISAKKLAMSVVPGAGVVNAARALRGSRHPENERIEIAVLK